MSKAAEILRAVQYAALKHAGQMSEYDPQAPFINHPIAMANMMAAAGLDDLELVQATLVHDVVEHTSTLMDDIRLEFGDEVARIVQEVTVLEEDAADRMKKMEALSSNISDKAKLVRLCDVISHLEEVEEGNIPPWTTKPAYLATAVKIVNECRGINAELEDRADLIIARNQ